MNNKTSDKAGEDQSVLVWLCPNHTTAVSKELPLWFVTVSWFLVLPVFSFGNLRNVFSHIPLLSACVLCLTQLLFFLMLSILVPSLSISLSVFILAHKQPPSPACQQQWEVT